MLKTFLCFAIPLYSYRKTHTQDQKNQIYREYQKDKKCEDYFWDRDFSESKSWIKRNRTEANGIELKQTEDFVQEKIRKLKIEDKETGSNPKRLIFERQRSKLEQSRNSG